MTSFKTTSLLLVTHGRQLPLLIGLSATLGRGRDGVPGLRQLQASDTGLPAPGRLGHAQALAPSALVLLRAFGDDVAQDLVQAVETLVLPFPGLGFDLPQLHLPRRVALHLHHLAVEQTAALQLPVLSWNLSFRCGTDSGVTVTRVELEFVISL